MLSTKIFRVAIFLLITFDAYSGENNASEIVFSTYLGGKGDDHANIVRADGAGNVFIGGFTEYWDNFPTLNAIQNSRQGAYSGIVAKFSGGGLLQWATHLGGARGSVKGNSVFNESDYVFNVVTGLAPDLNGGVYAAGTTTSSDFPTVNAIQSAPQSRNESFLTRFDKSGKIVWSTYIGGSGIHFATAIASTSNGVVYVTGLADVKCGVAKFDSAGKLIWSKTFGGDGHFTDGKSIATDVAGNVFVGGDTHVDHLPMQTDEQRYASFPKKNPYVAKFDMNGELLWSVKLGSPDEDELVATDVDRTGNVYVTGVTKSNQFPTQNASRPARSGHDDAFIAKFNSDGRLLWSTYLGGSGKDEVHAIAVDANDYIHITGNTASIRYPTKKPFQSKQGGGVDAFVTTFSPDGEIVHSSYLGNL